MSNTKKVISNTFRKNFIPAGIPEGKSTITPRYAFYSGFHSGANSFIGGSLAVPDSCIYKYIRKESFRTPS